MSNDTHTIYLLSKPFQIKATQEELSNLQQTASYLDSVLRTIKQTSRKPANFENLILTAALNLADELLQIKNASQPDYQAIDDRLERLKDKMADVLVEA